MGFLLPKPSFPSPQLPPPIPPPPTPDDPAIEARRKELQAAAKRRKGRQSTLITGGQGATGPILLDQPQLSPGLGG